MTCVIGWLEGKDILVGADSAGVLNYDLRVRADEKIFIKENMVFGFTGSFRMGQLLRYSLQIPEQSTRKDDYAYLCTDFIDAIIHCLEKNKYAKVENNEITGGNFLLGYKGTLYDIQDDFQVAQISLPYNAVGCGTDYALGALSVLKQDKNITGEKAILNALKISQEFSAGVREPFRILKLKG